MQRLLTSCLATGLAMTVILAFGAGTAPAIVITFEEGLGHDGTAINTQYAGVTFQGATTGIPWLYADATTNNYNISSWPSGTVWGTGNYWINEDVGAWTSEFGDNGKIAFNDHNATYIQTDYASGSEFFLEAYDSADQLLGIASGPANLRYSNSNPYGPGTLRVNAPSGKTIAYALVHDTGNTWCIDNVITDAGGIVRSGSSGTGQLQVVKFLDSNENGLFDSGERLLPGWHFLVSGPNGYSNEVTTGASGSVTLSDLALGDYTVSEVLQDGWDPTTSSTLVLNVTTDETAVGNFGNVPEPATLSLLALGGLLALRRRRSK